MPQTPPGSKSPSSSTPWNRSEGRRRARFLTAALLSAPSFVALFHPQTPPTRGGGVGGPGIMIGNCGTEYYCLLQNLSQGPKPFLKRKCILDRALKSPFGKGGFRGISGRYINPPCPPLQRGVINEHSKSFLGIKRSVLQPLLGFNRFAPYGPRLNLTIPPFILILPIGRCNPVDPSRYLLQVEPQAPRRGPGRGARRTGHAGGTSHSDPGPGG
jgi:hypothetical protein